MLKPIYFISGWIFFCLGIVGAFLPILPTTPFLLLAAYFFNKSSPRFHAWLLNMPVFGAAIQDWKLRRVIRPKAKILCVSMILLSLVVIWRSAQINIYVQSCVSLILISVGSFVASRKMT